MIIKLYFGKPPFALQADRWRSPEVTDRRRAVELINEAVEAGASKKKACSELEISSRTYRRWTQCGSVKADGSPDAERVPHTRGDEPPQSAH